MIDGCILFRAHCNELRGRFLALVYAHEMLDAVGVGCVSSALHIVRYAPIVERRKIEIADVFHAVCITIDELASCEVDSGL